MQPSARSLYRQLQQEAKLFPVPRVRRKMGRNIRDFFEIMRRSNASAVGSQPGETQASSLPHAAANEPSSSVDSQRPGLPNLSVNEPFMNFQLAASSAGSETERKIEAAGEAAIRLLRFLRNLPSCEFDLIFGDMEPKPQTKPKGRV